MYTGMYMYGLGAVWNRLPWRWMYGLGGGCTGHHGANPGEVDVRAGHWVYGLDLPTVRYSTVRYSTVTTVQYSTVRYTVQLGGGFVRLLSSGGGCTGWAVDVGTAERWMYGLGGGCRDATWMCGLKGGCIGWQVGVQAGAVPCQLKTCQFKTCRAVPGQNVPVQNVPCCARSKPCQFKACRAVPARPCPACRAVPVPP